MSFKFVKYCFTYIVFHICYSLLSNQPLFGEVGKLPVQIHTVSFSSGHYQGNGTDYVKFDSAIIGAADAIWIQLHFEYTTMLSNDSYLEVMSLEDSLKQTIDATRLKEWNNYSAFFNGDSVSVSLFVAPYDSGYFHVDWYSTGSTSPNYNPTPMCGTDDRIPSTDSRIGRIAVIDAYDSLEIGTTFIVQNGKLITAGHLILDTLFTYVVQFNVPMSKQGNIIRHPAAQDQYVINNSSIVGTNGGVGNDWAVYLTYDNSETSLSPITA